MKEAITEALEGFYPYLTFLMLVVLGVIFSDRRNDRDDSNKKN